MFTYGIGTQKFNSVGFDYKYKLTQFTEALIVGFQLMLAVNWSLALQTNIFAYQNQTWKPDGGGSESKSNTTFGFINKNNIFTLSLYFHLGGR